MIEVDRKSWGADAHERKVEHLYGGGIEKYLGHHDGYLNFGLWEDGIRDYVKAAENLVHRMGTILGLDEKSKLLDVAPGHGHTGYLPVAEFCAVFDRRSRCHLGTRRTRPAAGRRGRIGESRAL